MSRPSRVLYVHNFYRSRGGEETVLASEVDLARRHGVEVQIYARDSALASKHDVLKAVGGIYNRSVVGELRSVLQAFTPDLVHVHNAHPIVTDAVYDAAAEYGAPVVHTLHNYRTVCANAILFRNGGICEDCLGGSGYLGVRRRCYRNSVFASLATVTANQVRRARVRSGEWPNVWWIALSRFAKEIFVRGGFPESRVLVKGNFLDVVHESEPNTSRSNRAGCLFVGRLAPEKGLEEVMAVWDRIPERWRSLTIIGTGPLEQRVAEWAATRPHVRFLGQLGHDEVALQMKRHRLLLFPSLWYEGFPMVLLEAMAAGLGIVMTGLGAVPEIAPEGLASVRYAPDDSAGLIRVLQDLSEEDAERMGSFARQRFVDRYDGRAGWRDLLETYRRVLDSATDHV